MSPGCMATALSLVGHSFKQTDDGAGGFQPTDLAVTAQQQRRQMAGVGVGQGT